MNKPLLVLLPLCLSTMVVHSSYASSSISTRVKVVEEKVKMHDKKIREIKAQQEALDRNLASSKGNQINALSSTSRATPKEVVREKTAEEIRQERIAAAIQAKRQAEAAERAKQARLAALYKSRYAYP